MDRVQEMTVFCAVVENHGFSTAARRVALSAPAVTRAVAALEHRIGAQLLIRGSGPLRLTEAGQRFYDDARAILTDLDLAEELARGRDAEPAGNVALSSPILFGEMILTPLLLDWLQANPRVTMRAHFTDRDPDLHSEGLDVALVVGSQQPADVVVHEVGCIHRVVCAAPAYLDFHGAPTTINDLSAHRIVQSTADSRDGLWRFRVGDTATVLRPTAALTVSNNPAAIDAALAGFGIIRAMSYQVAADLAADRLRAVLVDADDSELPVLVAHLAGREASPKVAKLTRFLCERLQTHPALHARRQRSRKPQRPARRSPAQ